MREMHFKWICGATAAIFAVCLLAAGPASAAEDTIPPGTVITMKNWQKYKEFMPPGMQALFSGKYFWKFPADFQMDIGPTHDYPLPKLYMANTEKYAKNVKIINLPDGGHSIAGYVAGMPFPNPQAPLKGWKMLVNTWYMYVPHVQCAPDNDVYLLDRFGNRSHEVTANVYRQFSNLSDPGVPINDPAEPGILYAFRTRVLEPEQSKYTTQLTLYYTNPTKPEDLFLFIPALRRTLRLSSAARCSPFVGTDWTQDDVKQQFNGGIVRFDAKYMGEPKILELTVAQPKASANLANYYNILFPGPRVGKWEVRQNYLLDVRRIPSERAGYCYGKRMLYVDAQDEMQTWCDLYDANMKLWKPFSFQVIANNVPKIGKVLYTGQFIVGIWDLESDHASAWIAQPPFGANQQCANMNGHDFTNAKTYSSIAGLSLIQR